MARMNVDTDKMRECGSNIISLSNEYLAAVNAIFSRLLNISENGEWTGASADAFIEKTRLNQPSYISLGNQLKRYGEIIVESANDIDRASSRNVIG